MNLIKKLSQLCKYINISPLPRSRPAADCGSEIQRLDVRQVLTTSLTCEFASGILTINGTDEANQIVIHDNRKGVSAWNAETNDCLFSDLREVHRIIVNSMSGNDLIRIAGSRSVAGREGRQISIFGGAGDDRIRGGNSDDIINGGIGSDRIVGRRGNDYLDGGLGDDRLFGRRGKDRLTGGGQSLPPGSESLVVETTDDLLSGGLGHDLIKNQHGQTIRRGRHDKLCNSCDSDFSSLEDNPQSTVPETGSPANTSSPVIDDPIVKLPSITNISDLMQDPFDENLPETLQLPPIEIYKPTEPFPWEFDEIFSKEPHEFLENHFDWAIGMDEQQGIVMLCDLGLECRVLSREGVATSPFFTLEYKYSRCNLTVQNGKIASIAFY